MLISDRKKFIFLHNPKAAGSSIRSAFVNYDDRDNFFWDHEDNVKLSRVVDKAHITLDDFSVYPDAPLIEEYFVFGFVRNPYSRVYSAFLERKSQWGLSDDVDFNQFVQTELNEINIRFDWNFIHFCPQSYFFYSAGKCKADFIGRFEHLKRDFPRALNLAKLDTDVDLPYLNRRTSSTDPSGDRPDLKDYLEKYDPDSLSLINRLYDRDFVYFGYDKFFAEPECNDTDDNNAYTEAVYRKTGYIKGEEAYYAARMEKLVDENAQLRQKIEAGALLKDELYASRQELQTKSDELQALRNELQELRGASDQLEARVQEIQRMRNSLSWKMTRPLRRRENWDDPPG
jgi:hypothetical protein